MTTGYHPLVKRLLDGELSLAELPPELRAEGEEALRLVGAADRAPVALSPALEERVMAAVHPARAASRWRARSISGTAPPPLSCRPGGAAYGRLPSRSPSASISTRSWWMVHAGWRIRAPQPWTTALVAATASSP